MARISISVPDELMARMNPVKDGLNISQLCRDAIERRVSAYEATANHRDEELDLEGLILRLREERELAEGKFQKLGKKNAAAWLRTASFFEIRSIGEADLPSDVPKYRLPRSAFGMMKRNMEEGKASYDGVQAVVYKTAWVDYVRAVWSDVVDRLEEGNHAESADLINNGAVPE